MKAKYWVAEPHEKDIKSVDGGDIALIISVYNNLVSDDRIPDIEGKVSYAKSTLRLALKNMGIEFEEDEK